MFNLTEKHIIVVIVLISVIFLLFLSTRTPMCIKEGFRGKNHYSEVNNDLFMEKGDFANVNVTKSKVTDSKANQNNKVLLTKSDMENLKGSYQPKTEDKLDVFDNSIQDNLNNEKSKYKSLIDDEKLNEIIEDKVDKLVNAKITNLEKIDNSEVTTLNENIPEPPIIILDDKPFDYGNKCSDIPEGNNLNDNYSPFGLNYHENDIFTNTTNNKVNNLGEEKCSLYRDAILNLNKTGMIDNNNVESSWNNTFKDNCGNW